MNLDHFGMDTITLAGPLEAKLRAVKAAGFTQIMLNATDIVGHPEGESAAIAAVRASGLRVTGFQVLRDVEGLAGHLHAYKVDVAKAMLEMCHALGSSILLACSSTSAHATGETDSLKADLQKLALLAVPLKIRIAYEALSWGRYVNEFPQSWDLVQEADRANLGVCLDSYHILANRTDLGLLPDIDPQRVFLVQLSDFMWQELRSPEDRIDTARHFRVFPGEGVHNEQLAELVRQVDGMGYRGDYSFEVFNDDYRQLPLPMVCERAKRSVKWVSEFVSRVLADRACGAHLCHAMLLPRQESIALLPRFEDTGQADLNGARIERHGKASIVTMRNPRYLNAEDESTLDGMETAVDLALLDPETEVCVLRGGAVEHPKFAGRRLFGAGINLTHLYQGKIRFLWYLIRDLGYVNKLYRGLATADSWPEERSIEKLWIAAVDGFAIGGHCQVLLTMDYTLAAHDAYLTLPARKEGIIPGAANLRLPRFVGDRIARQAILAERRIDCASAEGRMICDEIVPAQGMDEAISKIVNKLTGSGVVSAAGNRRAFRAGEEPLDLFRRYMAVYAREQAYCHFSPALIANLEKNWKIK